MSGEVKQSWRNQARWGGAAVEVVAVTDAGALSAALDPGTYLLAVKGDAGVWFKRVAAAGSVAAGAGNWAGAGAVLEVVIEDATNNRLAFDCDTGETASVVIMNPALGA